MRTSLVLFRRPDSKKIVRQLSLNLVKSVELYDYPNELLFPERDWIRALVFPFQLVNKTLSVYFQK